RHQARAVRVRPGDDDGWHSHHVGSEPGGDELLDELAGRDDDLSAQMATFLRGGKLVLEMNAGCAGFDHRLRDLECMERPAEFSSFQSFSEPRSASVCRTSIVPRSRSTSPPPYGRRMPAHRSDDFQDCSSSSVPSIIRLPSRPLVRAYK